jgi:serine/threonine protein kinase
MLHFYFLVSVSTDVWALGCCLYSMAFLQNCFEEGSNLAILSGKYVIPDDNPYGDGLVELLERMLCSDSKARADMTEVILCLSAVYSGRPLPPRKKSSKPKKEKEEVKVETAEQPDTRAGTFRTDGQGVQEVVYDPTKATQAKKLDQNSAAARRKRAAAAAAAKPPPAPAPSSKASNDNKSSSDPIDFNVFDAKGDEALTSAGFSDSKAFGEMKGFEDNGNASGKDFFGSFDNALMESKAGNASSDGFDAFDASAWASTDNNMDALTSGNAAEVTPPPPVTSSLDDAVPAAAVAPAGEPPDATASDHKRENSDSQRKHRSSRRRDQKHKSSSSSREPEVPSVEGLNIQEGEAGRKESEEAKKERRSRRTDRSKDDDEHRRRRSTSRKRRGGKTRDGREKQSEGESSEKKPVKRGTSFKGVFGRRQTPPEP